MPCISVIVPVYNVEQYLSRCIDSILFQTFADFELILVDDGSTDSSPAICDAYAAQDERVTVIHKKNGGVSAARNAALDVANGEYIAFCDSDDYWEECLLERALETIRAEQADCVHFGYHIHESENNHFSTSFKPGCYTFTNDQDRTDYLACVLLLRLHGWELWDHIFRRDIVEQYNIRCCTKCNNFAEDLGFVCRYILHANRLCCIPDCLYHYCMRNSSMMRKSKKLVRLNDVNEVSFDVGSDFYRTVTDAKTKKCFPVLHLLIMYNQLSKLCTDLNLPEIPSALQKLEKQTWFQNNISKLFFCYSYLKKCYSTHLARRTLLFVTYLQHGNWKLYAFTIKSLKRIRMFLNR